MVRRTEMKIQNLGSAYAVEYPNGEVRVFKKGKQPLTRRQLETFEALFPDRGEIEFEANPRPWFGSKVVAKRAVATARVDPDKERELASEIMQRLFDEAILGRQRLRTGRNLFGPSGGEQSRRVLEMLNEAAGPFFAEYQYLSQADSFMTLSRLTDRPRIGSHEVVTVHRLCEQVRRFAAPSESAKLQSLADVVSSKVAAIRTHRDRRFAHVSRLTEPDAVFGRDFRLAYEAIFAFLEGAVEVLGVGPTDWPNPDFDEGTVPSQSIIRFMWKTTEALKKQAKGIACGSGGR